MVRGEEEVHGAMTFGLPAHLSGPATIQAYSRAAKTVAAVLLVGALCSLVALQAAAPDTVLWPAAVALAPMLGLLWYAHRHRSAFAAAAFLGLGAACHYAHALVLFAALRPHIGDDIDAVMLPQVALVLGGGAGASLRSSLLWATGGFLAAGFTTSLAVVQTGGTPRFALVACFALLAYAGLLAILWFDVRRTGEARPRLYQAVREQRVAGLRASAERRAAAVLHDTVLGHLAAVAAARSGPLDPALAERVRGDLAALIGEEWLQTATRQERSTAARWRSGELGRTIDELREDGLTVQVSGDPHATDLLDPVRATALVQAARQCLVNVQRHAGVDRAELTVHVSDSEVSVMVVDAGRGFDVDGTGADRLGLRTSVAQRMEAVGGAMRIWSSPGDGTAVLLSAPLAPVADHGAADDERMDGGAAALGSAR